MYRIVAKKIKELREDRDITQQKIAEILKIDQSYYAKYENGKHPIPIQHLKTLCEYYKVSANYLLQIPETNDRTKDEILERTKQMKDRISKETAEKIIRWAEYQGHIKGDIEILIENIYNENK